MHHLLLPSCVPPAFSSLSFSSCAAAAAAAAAGRNHPAAPAVAFCRACACHPQQLQQRLQLLQHVVHAAAGVMSRLLLAPG
jgi:hypothetical protein